MSYSLTGLNLGFYQLTQAHPMNAVTAAKVLGDIAIKDIYQSPNLSQIMFHSDFLGFTV